MQNILLTILWDNWLPLVVAVLIAFGRIFSQNERHGCLWANRLCRSKGSLPMELTPVALWGIGVTQFTYGVHETHASIYPKLVAYSAQLFVGHVLMLSFILAIGFGGQWVANRSFPNSRRARCSPMLIVLAIAPLVDWVFASCVWWSYIARHLP